MARFCLAYNCLLYTSILIAIVKYIEDKRNVLHDTRAMGVPVLLVDVYKRQVETVVKSPAQRNRPRLGRNDLADDGTVPRDLYIHGDVRASFNMNDLGALLRPLPALRRLICAVRIEVFDECVRHGGPDVREPPRNSLIVAHDHVRHSWPVSYTHLDVYKRQGYAAVPTAPLIGTSPGAVIEMDLTSGNISATISVPNAQTVVSNPGGSQLLVFSNDSDNVTVVSPALETSGNPVTFIVPLCTGCRPVNAVFSSDGGIAYILNCGAECQGTQASVQVLNLATTPPSLGASVPVDGATIGLLNGSTLYVAGFSPSTANHGCPGETTAATTCGRLDIVDTGSMTVTGSAVITDGYHDRIDMGLGSQLFVGSHTCTNIGNVNNVTGEVRGCLSIYNTTNGNVTIPPDNGDVTGLQSFTSRYVEYVAEGGNLRVYDTTIDSLLLNDYISNGTIIVTGVITDVKAVDFF